MQTSVFDVEGSERWEGEEVEGEVDEVLGVGVEVGATREVEGRDEGAEGVVWEDGGAEEGGGELVGSDNLQEWQSEESASMRKEREREGRTLKTNGIVKLLTVLFSVLSAATHRPSHSSPAVGEDRSTARSWRCTFWTIFLTNSTGRSDIPRGGAGEVV